MRQPKHSPHDVLEALDYRSFERLARQGDLIPVYRDLRGDTETPVGAWLKLGSPKSGFLLESVEGGERWGRYSFIGDAPRARIRQRGQKTTVEDSAGRRVLEGTPLEALRQVLGKRTVASPGGMPPFVGGLVGYLSYSAIRWFEPRVPQRLGPDPDFDDAEWLLVDRLIAFDNLRHRIKLIALADLERHGSTKAAYQAAKEQLDTLSAALDSPLPPRSAPPRVSHMKDVWGPGQFVKAVERVQEYIRAGDCMQVVLSRRLEARYQGDPFELYRRQRAASPAPYLFYLRFGPRALVGASPELLVRVSGDAVTVRPIAGTRPRGKTPADDLGLEQELRADPKELAEHVMLVDLGRNDVGRVASPGTVRIEEREVVERYSHVMHLVSQVSGRLRPGLDALDAIAAAFPAGTVSGAPKVRAMEIIDELEPVPRGPYAGGVGYLGFDGNADLAIAIRSVALAGSRLRFQAGAGLVFDSDAGRELEETSHKLRGVLSALGTAEPKRAPKVAARSRAKGARR